MWFTRKIDKNHIYVFSMNKKWKHDKYGIYARHECLDEEKINLCSENFTEINGGTIWFLSFHAIIIIVITIFNYISLNVVWIENLVYLNKKKSSCLQAIKYEFLESRSYLASQNHWCCITFFVSFLYLRFFKTRQNGVFKSMKFDSMAPGSIFSSIFYREQKLNLLVIDLIIYNYND